MKLKLLFLITTCVAVLAAQNAGNDPNQPGSKQVTRVVRVHGDAFSISNLLGRSGSVEHQATSALRAIVLKGPASDVDSVERTIQELDSLGSSSDTKNIELTTVVVAGSMTPISGTQELTGEALAPVVKQLRSIFPYRSYQTLSTMLLRVTQGEAAHDSQGSLKWLQQGSEGARSGIDYSLNYGPVSMSADGFIHLAEVRFGTSVPLKSVMIGKDGMTTTSISQQRVEIRTRVDLREGQKVVVGSATVADADVCLFLVVSARLVQ